MKFIKVTAILLALLFALTGLAACGSEDAPAAVDETTAGDAAETTVAEETTAAEPTVDLSGITGTAFGKVLENGVLYFFYDGATATLTAVGNGDTVQCSGALTATETELTFGDKTFEYKILGTFLTLTEGETKYTLTKTTDETAPQIEALVTILSNKWTGDGAELSFDGSNATVKFDAEGINYTGPYMTTTSAITVVDASAGNPSNLAEGCDIFASGVEADTFPPEQAVDGDYTTRFASDYVDPSWIYIDLGAEKEISAVVLYWEAANAKVFDLQVSNTAADDDWTTVYSDDDHSTYGTADAPVGDEIRFDSTSARYIRMYGTERNLTYGYSLWEFEVYTAIAGQAEIGYALDGDALTVTVNGNAYTLAK